MFRGWSWREVRQRNPGHDPAVPAAAPKVRGAGGSKAAAFTAGPAQEFAVNPRPRNPRDDRIGREDRRLHRPDWPAGAKKEARLFFRRTGP